MQSFKHFSFTIFTENSHKFHKEQPKKAIIHLERLIHSSPKHKKLWEISVVTERTCLTVIIIFCQTRYFFCNGKKYRDQTKNLHKYEFNFTFPLAAFVNICCINVLIVSVQFWDPNLCNYSTFLVNNRVTWRFGGKFLRRSRAYYIQNSFFI